MARPAAGGDRPSRRSGAGPADRQRWVLLEASHWQAGDAVASWSTQNGPPAMGSPAACIVAPWGLWEQPMPLESASMPAMSWRILRLKPKALMAPITGGGSVRREWAPSWYAIAGAHQAMAPATIPGAEARNRLSVSRARGMDRFLCFRSGKLWLRSPFSSVGVAKVRWLTYERNSDEFSHLCC